MSYRFARSIPPPNQKWVFDMLFITGFLLVLLQLLAIFANSIAYMGTNADFLYKALIEMVLEDVSLL